MKNYHVYILTNNNNTTLYIGVTNNIQRRLYEHRQGLFDGFSKKYKLKKLIYIELFTDIHDAIRREKQLKNWHRDWKFNLIRESNPTLKDLAPGYS